MYTLTGSRRTTQARDAAMEGVDSAAPDANISKHDDIATGTADGVDAAIAAAEEQGEHSSGATMQQACILSCWNRSTLRASRGLTVCGHLGWRMQTAGLCEMHDPFPFVRGHPSGGSVHA